MICGLCRADTVNKVRVRDGYICNNCFNKLPMSFQKSNNKITVDNIKEAKKVLKDKYSSPWATCSGVGICYQGLQINGFEINLSDIKKVSLNFHPQKPGGKKNYVYGTVSIIIETKIPHMVFEEPFFNTEIKYYISGKEISYSYPSSIQVMITKLQENINNGIFNTDSLRPKKKEKKDEGRGREGVRARQEKGKLMSEFEQAKKLFCVEIPFKKEILITKKRALLKVHHPDMGGTPEMADRIYKAYDLLLKYAED